MLQQLIYLVKYLLVPLYYELHYDTDHITIQGCQIGFSLLEIIVLCDVRLIPSNQVACHNAGKGRRCLGVSQP